MEDIKFLFLTDKSNKRVRCDVNKAFDDYKQNNSKSGNPYIIVFKESKNDYQEGETDFQVYVYRSKHLRLIGRAKLFIDGRLFKGKVRDKWEIKKILHTISPNEKHDIQICGTRAYYKCLKQMLLLDDVLTLTKDVFYKRDGRSFLVDSEINGLDFEYQIQFKENGEIKDSKKVYTGCVIDLSDKCKCKDIIKAATLRYKKEQKNCVSIRRVEADNCFYNDNIDAPSKIIFVEDNSLDKKSLSNKEASYFKRYRYHDMFCSICTEHYEKNIDINKISCDIDPDKKIFLDNIILKLTKELSASLYRNYKSNELTQKQRNLVQVIYELILNIRNNSMLILNLNKVIEFIFTEDANENEKQEFYLAMKKTVEEIIKNGNKYFGSSCILVNE